MDRAADGTRPAAIGKWFSESGCEVEMPPTPITRESAGHRGGDQRGGRAAMELTVMDDDGDRLGAVVGGQAAGLRRGRAAGGVVLSFTAVQQSSSGNMVVDVCAKNHRS
jgi:hypothetical protein